MICKNCGNQVEDGSMFCQSCGANLSELEPAEAAQPQVEEAAPVSEVQTTEVLQPQAEEFAPVPQQVVPAKKKGTKLLIAVIAIVLVLGILVVFAGKSVVNSVKLATMDPAKYYAGIEKANIHGLLKEYDTSADALESFSLDSKIGVEVTDDGKDFLSLMGVNLDDYIDGAKIELDTKIAGKDDVYSVDITAALNSVDIISGNVILDAVKQEIYGKVPELSEKAFNISLSDLDMDGAEEILNSGLDLDVDIAALAEKYTDIVFDNIMDFEKSKETLTVSGVSMNANKFSSEVTYADLVKIAKSVLEEAKEDKEITDLICSNKAILFGSEDMDDAEIISEYSEGIDGLIEELDYYSDNQEVVFKYNAWIDAKGNIVARELVSDGLSAGIYNAYTSSEYGSEIVFDVYDEMKLALAGSAKLSGKCLKDGLYTVSYSDGYNTMDVAEIKLHSYDISAAEKYNSDFECSISLCDDIVAMAEGAESILKNISLNLAVEGTDKKSDCELAVCYSGDELVILSINGELSKGESISIPQDAVSIDEYAEELETVQDFIMDIMSKLQEAGVNADILSSVLSSGF